MFGKVFFRVSGKLLWSSVKTFCHECQNCIPRVHRNTFSEQRENFYFSELQWKLSELVINFPVKSSKLILTSPAENPTKNSFLREKWKILSANYLLEHGQECFSRFVKTAFYVFKKTLSVFNFFKARLSLWIGKSMRKTLHTEGSFFVS